MRALNVFVYNKWRRKLLDFSRNNDAERDEMLYRSRQTEVLRIVRTGMYNITAQAPKLRPSFFTRVSEYIIQSRSFSISLVKS